MDLDLPILEVMRHFELTHPILYYTILYYTILYYTILFYTLLYSAIRSERAQKVGPMSNQG